MNNNRIEVKLFVEDLCLWRHCVQGNDWAVAAVTTSVNENPNPQLILNETCGGDEERT